MDDMAKVTETIQIDVPIQKTKTTDNVSIYLFKKMINWFWEFVDLLSYKSEKIARLYEKAIGEEYQKEYRESGIKKKDRILHIGCGSYPLSEISLARLFRAQVVGIDKNPKAVKLASEVVKSKHLEKQISIHHGNGVDYAVDGFDVIIVSSCSLPKGRILDNVFSLAKKKSMIIVREIAIATDDVYDRVNAHRDIVLMKKIENNPGLPFLFGWDTIFLMKN